MKLRLTGKKDEVETMVDFLESSIELDVLEVSDFYPNRGNSKLGRVYMELEVR